MSSTSEPTAFIKNSPSGAAPELRTLRVEKSYLSTAKDKNVEEA